MLSDKLCTQMALFLSVSVGVAVKKQNFIGILMTKCRIKMNTGQKNGNKKTDTYRHIASISERFQANGTLVWFFSAESSRKKTFYFFMFKIKYAN